MSIFTFVAPNELILEIPSHIRDRSQQAMQSFPNPLGKYQVFVNKLCLLTILPWVQENFNAQARPYPSSSDAESLSELINGIAIAAGSKRLIVIPSEAMDLSELRVAQEWVDIEGFVGDYYLSTQIETDDNYVRIWGYCTHQQLKAKGQYDPIDRTYSLSADDLSMDVSNLVLTCQMGLEETTKSVVAPFPKLGIEQAQNLISRLGSSEVAIPRLQIPFELW